MTPFYLLHGCEVATMLNTMLPHENKYAEMDAGYITQLAEEARQLDRR